MKKAQTGCKTGNDDAIPEVFGLGWMHLFLYVSSSALLYKLIKSLS